MFSSLLIVDSHYLGENIYINQVMLLVQNFIWPEKETKAYISKQTSATYRLSLTKT